MSVPLLLLQLPSLQPILGMTPFNKPLRACMNTTFICAHAALEWDEQTIQQQWYFDFLS